MQVLKSFQSVQLIWIYFVVERFPTSSNVIVLILCTTAPPTVLCKWLAPMFFDDTAKVSTKPSKENSPLKEFFTWTVRIRNCYSGN